MAGVLPSANQGYVEWQKISHHLIFVEEVSAVLMTKHQLSLAAVCYRWRGQKDMAEES